jgi:hypothetical protein
MSMTVTMVVEIQNDRPNSTAHVPIHLQESIMIALQQHIWLEKVETSSSQE